MAGTPTTRLKLPIPGQGDPADVPTDLGKLANALDPATVIYGQGTLAARPAAGTQGRLYYATDTKLVYYDDGTAWQTVASPPPPMQFGTATLTTTAAASGSVTVSHSLGVVPRWVGVTPMSSGIISANAGMPTLTATQFAIGYFYVDGQSRSSSNPCMWVAMA